MGKAATKSKVPAPKIGGKPSVKPVKPPMPWGSKPVTPMGTPRGGPPRLTKRLPNLSQSTGKFKTPRSKPLTTPRKPPSAAKNMMK
jgi:hypothetical protein